MLEEHKNSSAVKCEVRTCKLVLPLKCKCCNPTCKKAVHMGCYERIVLVQKDKEPRPPLPDNQVACTKACYTVVAKVDAIDNRGTWCLDGNGGPQDPNHSMKLLLYWWCTPGQHDKCAGKNNEGVKKMTVCEDIAKRIRNSKKDGDDEVRHVILKFKYMDPNLLNRNKAEGSKSEAGSVKDQSHDNGLS